MAIIKSISYFIWWAVSAVTLAGIVLILLRSIFNYRDANPFKWSVRQVRRLTEPVLLPVRGLLRGMRIDPSVAPFIAVLALIVAWYLLTEVAASVLNMIAGVLYATTAGPAGGAVAPPVAIFGYLLFGCVGLYTLGIFVRIIFSWIGGGYGNRFSRFLFRITEPLLGPLRRSIRPIGMFDVSPIVAFLLLWLTQIVIAGTLLRGWPTRFF